MLFAPFKLCQPPHFVGRELKIEYFRIFLDVRGIARARDHRDVTLQIPAQNDLSGGLSVGAADPDDLGVLLHFCVVLDVDVAGIHIFCPFRAFALFNCKISYVFVC